MRPTDDSGLPTPPAIRAEYKQKLAVCYIRQSTLDQVKTNTGSTETQRALAARARWYGWAPERIKVIDEDLGLSGTSSDQRTGFQKLLGLMERGDVGLILVRDASRISRDRLDSARFWRMAISADVLVEVSGRLRHPATDKATDRFGLEMESVLAWYENEYKTEMLQAAKVAKIGQRRAVSRPPMGYVRAGRGDWEKGPEPAVCSVIRQMIDAYLQFSSFRKARRHLQAQGVRYPRRRRGRIEWTRLTDGDFYRLLTNPNYTPDYFFCRSTEVQQPNSPKRRRLRDQDEWLVVRDHHEGYMTRDEWARIQSLLHQRARMRQPFPGKGAGLLQGLLSCGHCGRWMRTVHDGRDIADPVGRTARYRCAPRDSYGDELHRLSCPAPGIDHVVVRAVLRALTPPSLTHALEAIGHDQQQHEAAELARRRHLRSAEERVFELKQRYFDVDAARPMLKVELERDLEAALQDLQRLRQQLAEQPQSQTITGTQATELVRLAANLNSVWSASTTTNEDRKRILSAALTKIVVHDNGPEAFEVELIWVGGLAERLPLLRRAGAAALVAQMAAEGRSKKEILAEVTERGLTNYRGQLITSRRLSETFRQLGLGMKKTRPKTQERIRQMLLEGRSQREILHALQGLEGQWTPNRLGKAITSLRRGVWGQGVPQLPSDAPPLRKLELATIRLFADRRRADVSFQQIADELNALGARTPQGHAFTASNARFTYRALQQDPSLADIFDFDDLPRIQRKRSRRSRSTASTVRS